MTDSLASDLAEQCIHRAIEAQPPRFRSHILAQIIRGASRMKAEGDGHQSLEFLHAELVREHHEKRASQGVKRSSGR
jgi:hypothetical protein